MRPRTYTTEGFVLNRLESGEADRILTVYTRKYGKIRCLAKGVRKLTSRKSGHLELFDLSSLFLAKSKTIDYLIQAQVVKSYSALRSSLKAVKAAFHVSEIVDLLVPIEQENEFLFADLKRIFSAINRQKMASKKQILSFEKKILVDLGFGLPQKDTPERLLSFIESIVEKKLNTINIFKDI